MKHCVIGNEICAINIHSLTEDKNSSIILSLYTGGIKWSQMTIISVIAIISAAIYRPSNVVIVTGLGECGSI